MNKMDFKGENPKNIETLYYEIMNPENPFFRDITPPLEMVSLDQPSLLMTVESITTYNAYENQRNAKLE